jgi:hypothetical protein
LYSLLPALRTCNILNHILRQKEKNGSQEQLKLTREAQPMSSSGGQVYHPAKLMRRIQNRVADVGLSARKADVFVRFGMFIVRLAFGQVGVIVVLMHDHDRWRAVNDSPAFLACFVDHPVIPACATDGKVREIGITGIGKKEEVASCRTVKLVPVF